MSEEDYSSLLVEEKLVHKVWKVRLEGYEEIIKQFQNSRNENDTCFQRYNQEPGLFKKFVTDANVVAQETAITALATFLEFGGTASNIHKLKSAGVISSLCEKGLSSSRAGTKQKSTDVLLWFVEIGNDGGPVVEDILPFLTHRLPKLVAGCVGALTSMVENFGPIVPAKLIIPALPKLYAHADRNVRAETTKLTVELYKWMGEALPTILFPDLKPVQQKDLTAAFEKVKDEPAEQKRLTRSQQAAKQQAEELQDVEMEEAVQEEAQPAFDPFEMLDPIDVLSKFPSDLHERISSAKWKDRKEVLDEVVEVLSKAPKLVVADYSDFVKILSKCMKDANIQVVQLAANSVEFLAKGLKQNFARYQPLLLGPMIERTKEKKPSVADALNNALDSLFSITGLSEILDETLNAMKHKTPQIKIASTNFLQRCLRETTKSPTPNEVDSIINLGVKLLSDSQEPVRQAATEMIGTLMKITGERELNPFLEKVDDNRKAKVKKFYETVTVKAKSAPESRKPAAAPATKTSSRPTSEASSLASRRLGGTKPKLSAPGQTIPSKRTATSPAKRADDTQKLAASRSLTGRSLLSPKPLNFAPAIPPSPVVKRDVISEEQLEELRSLRKEKQEWLSEKERFLQIQQDFQNDKQFLNQEISHYRQEFETVSKNQNNAELMNKQKDVQILRLKSDLENTKLKIRDLEQTIEMMKLEQNQQAHNIPAQTEPQFTSPKISLEARQTYSPDTRITSGELSSRVHRMSIDGDSAKENAFSPGRSSRLSPQKFSDNTNTYSNYNSLQKDLVADDESWRRAAEVTSQLKARIEKMKARSRTVNSGI